MDNEAAKSPPSSKPSEKTAESYEMIEFSSLKSPIHIEVEGPTIEGPRRLGLGITLIVFINSKSGGQQGQIVYSKLAKILPNSCIFDLSNGGPSVGLNQWKDVMGWRVLACGGDGTAGWVLSELDKIKQGEGGMPPVGVLPLGTGNDLSRTLGWGGGYEGENLFPILEEIQHSEVILLDRWKIYAEPGVEFVQEKEAPPQKTGEELHESQDDLKPREFIMNNYFSIGADADIALSFHNLRNEHPTLFTHRIINKGWYGAISIKSMFRGPVPLMNCIQIWVDDKPINISKKIVGILVLNLPFWAGGSTPWGNPFKNKNNENLGKSGSAEELSTSRNRSASDLNDRSPDFRERRNSSEDISHKTNDTNNNNNNHTNDEDQKNSESTKPKRGEKKKKVPKHFEIPSVSDKMIEVIGLKGVMHMGTIKSGISKGKRLAQGQRIRIITTLPLPAQVDGEPWILSPSTVSVSHFSQSPMLRKKGAVILPFQKETKNPRPFSTSPPHTRGSIPNIFTLRSTPSSPMGEKDNNNNNNNNTNNHNDHHNFLHNLFTPHTTTKRNSSEIKTSPTSSNQSNRLSPSPSRSPSSSLDSVNVNVKQQTETHHCVECNLFFSSVDLYDAHILSEHPNWLKAHLPPRSYTLLEEESSNTTPNTSTTTSPSVEVTNTENKTDQLN